MTGTTVGAVWATATVASVSAGSDADTAVVAWDAAVTAVPVAADPAAAVTGTDVEVAAAAAFSPHAV